jgi:hypothetical protein
MLPGGHASLVMGVETARYIIAVLEGREPLPAVPPIVRPKRAV